MATSYNTIHNLFLKKVSDYDLPQLEELTQERVVMGYLDSAIARTWRILTQIDFTKRDEPMQFSGDLDAGFEDDFDMDSLDILTEWMVFFWLEPYQNNLDLLRVALSTKDFSITSPANLLDKITNRFELCRKHAISIMNQYSFRISDIERLRP